MRQLRQGGPRRNTARLLTKTQLVGAVVGVLLCVASQLKRVLDLSPSVARLTVEDIFVSPLLASIDSTSDLSQQKQSVQFWVYPGRPRGDWGELFQLDQAKNASSSLLYYAYESALDGLTRAPALTVSALHGLQNWIGPGTRTPPAYKRFLEGHMFYKVQHRERYPHHLQSVLVCSFILNHPKQKLWYANYSAHLEQACAHYEPTSEDSEPPIWVDFVIPSERFAVLSYDTRVQTARDANSGDEVQSLASSQFAPFISDLVDGEVGFPSLEENVFVVANAWYGAKPAFPPSNKTVPSVSFISAHISASGRRMVSNYLDFWKSYNQARGPIGARDQPTLEFLQQCGLSAYLSSCFTLTYNIPLAETRTSIVIVAVAQTFLPPDVWEAGVKLACNIPDHEKSDTTNRYRYAYRLLDTYRSTAKVVITSRIHVALPSAAMGLPVIFVAAAKLPGGGGRRTEGIDDLFHLYRPQSGQKFDYDLDNMPPNPGVHRMDRYRATHWKQLKKLSPFYVETAKLHGYVPFRRLGHGLANFNQEEVHDDFHLISTTSEKTLNWRMIRTFENIFHHHPNARVTLHSNTLPVQGSVLDIFVESGYDLVIQKFDIAGMLLQGPWPKEQVEMFCSNMTIFEKGKHWYSHESDVLRYLVLWKYGGVYFDLDVYSFHPIPRTTTNVLGRQDDNMINGAAMIFERGHPFIVACISYVVRNYRREMNGWTAIGPSLVTKIYKASPQGFNLTILDENSFQPIHYAQVMGLCFSSQENTIQVNLNSTIAMHLNNKLTSRVKETKRGTLCDRILHEHCIFCDEVHRESG